MSEEEKQKIIQLCQASFPSQVDNTPCTIRSPETKIPLCLLYMQPLSPRQARILTINLTERLVILSTIYSEGDGQTNYQDQQLELLLKFQRLLTFSHIGFVIGENCTPDVVDKTVPLLTKALK